MSIHLIFITASKVVVIPILLIKKKQRLRKVKKLTQGLEPPVTELG